MSNAGQAILTVVGTVVGAYFGYPQLGFVLGSLAGQALFPTQLPGVTGPKLTDGNTTSAQVGDPVCWLFGRDWSSGTVIWLDEIETVTNTDHQGKGGPSQDFTTFTYFQSIALGICEGEDITTGKGRKALIAVWENGELKYDVREQRADESDDAHAARLASSAEYASTFVFYDGGEDQLPDPTIEAVRGIGNTPGYRGLCYIVYPRRQLQDKQAQRHPSFRFLVDDCTGDFSAVQIYDQPGTYQWRRPGGLKQTTVTLIGAGAGGQAGSVGIPAGFGLAVGGVGGGGGGASRATFQAADLPSEVTISVGFGGQGAPQNSTPLSFGTGGEDGGDTTFGGFLIAGGGVADQTNQGDSPGGSGNLASGGPGSGGGIAPTTDPDSNTTGAPSGSDNHGKPAGAGGGGGAGGTQFGGAAGAAGGSGEADPDGPPPGAVGGEGGTLGDNHPPDPILLAGPGFAGHESLIHHGGGGGGGGGGCRNDSGGKGGVGGRWGGGGGGGGGSTGGGVGGAGGEGAPGIAIIENDFGDESPCVQTRFISEIVSRICARVNLTAIDLSAIGDTQVDGYGLRRQMNARSAIDPLRSVGWFDVVESGRSLKFVQRGGPMVAQLTEDDLGAREYGSTPGPAISTKKNQNVDLPRVLRLHYYAVSRDYEFGEAQSPARISSRAVNDMDVELPVAISDQLAAEVAEALWADIWAGEYTHETTVDRAWMMLEGTDPLGIPVDGLVQRMRIQSITDSSVLLRKLTLIRDDDDSYIPVAVGSSPERPPDQIGIKAPTQMLLLDLPPLRPEDDDAGIYAAVGPATGSRWEGAVIFRSCDGGLTWNPLTDQLFASLIGTLDEALPEGLSEITDLGNTLLVTFPSYSPVTPSSVTLEQLLAGANAFAIGHDGRWEVGQFQTATQVGPNSWALTVLLRGRRGTEHVMGSSEAGDTFVLLDENALTRLPVENSQIGESCTYRPVTLGTTFSANADQDENFEHHGVALLPFSPVDLAAELDGPDILVSWIRRDRIGQTLPIDGVFPLSEAAELYDLEVVYANTDTVIRTIAGLTTPEATYTEAQRIADGTNLLELEDLGFRVYQISAVVGRGTPGLLRADNFAVPPEPERSDDLSYLAFVKGPYEGSTSLPWLAYRERFDGYVVDVQENGSGAPFSIRVFQDGETAQSGSAGAFDVVAVARDQADARYFYIAQQDGNEVGLTPGKVRKIDSQAFIIGGLLEDVTVAQVDVSALGDPQSCVVIGDHVFVACPYEVAIRKYAAADLSLEAVLTPSVPIWTLATDGADLWGVQRDRPATLHKINQSTGADLASYPCADFPLDLKVVLGFAWMVSVDEVKLVKYSLADGSRQAFELALPAESFSSLRNYLTLDGTRLSVGRREIFVIDTTNDTIL